MVDETLWRLKLRAFLHDPPDKALMIRGHEERVSDVLLGPLGISKDAQEQNMVEVTDHVASAMQRINIPDEIEGMLIDFTRRTQPEIRHTLSGIVDRPAISSKIESAGVNRYLLPITLTGKITHLIGVNHQKTFLQVWRCLAEEEPLYSDLPADTRIPDHTIWDHLDVTSGLVPSLDGGLAFLSFKLSPVQEFIGHARKTADLWAGSHILSYLSFNAMLPILEELGPDAIIFPYLRGQPFLDYWLTSQMMSIDKFDQKTLEVSNIPHRFLAIVPADRSEIFEDLVKRRLDQAWQDIAEFTKKEVVKLLQEVQLDTFFAETWFRQVRNAFRSHTAVVKWAHPPESEQAVEDWLQQAKTLPADIWRKYDDWMEWYRRPGKYRANTGVLYGLYYEMVGYLVDQRSRLFQGEDEPSEKGGREGGKCTVCGIRNQLKPQNLEAAIFWERARNMANAQGKSGMVEQNERLCAVCLTKRLYRFYAEKKLKIRKMTPSVASIATRQFRKACVEKAEDDVANFVAAYYAVTKSVNSQVNQNPKEILVRSFQNEDDIDGEWLFPESYTKDYVKQHIGHEPPEADLQRVTLSLHELYRKVGFKPAKYYAILAMDGDRMGAKLRGDGLPSLANFMHVNIKNELTKNVDLDRMIQRPRILNPKVHMAISRALKDFSTLVVRKVVEDYDGILIYSGGDDVLAFLPAERALEAALELNSWFGKDFIEWGGKKLSMLGKGSTMSAGIVFTHYKYPLHDALSMATEARESAKEDYGREAFVLTSVKRSGQKVSVGAKWDIMDDLRVVVNELIRNVSTGIIYKLSDEAPVLESLGEEDAVKSEIKRLFRRHSNEDVTSDQLNRLVNSIDHMYNRLSELEPDQGKALQHVINLLKIALDAVRGD